MIRNSQAVDNLELVQRLRHLGLSPEQFAAKCQDNGDYITNITIRNYEKGAVTRPRRGTVLTINSNLERLERLAAFQSQMEATGK